MKNHEQQQSQPASELPEDVADAWAAVLIDVYEKRKHKSDTEDLNGAVPEDTSAPSQENGDNAQYS